MDINQLTTAYVNLRKARAELSAEYTAADNDLKAKIKRIDAAMLDLLNKSNTESMRTAAGTFYRQEEITPRGEDWQAFYLWVAENNAFDALEKRIKKTFVKDFMEANDGAIPPGVSVFKEYVVRVRKS